MVDFNNIKHMTFQPKRVEQHEAEERYSEMRLVDDVARICAEFPADWEWPGNVAERELEKYRAIARRVLVKLGRLRE